MSKDKLSKSIWKWNSWSFLFGRGYIQLTWKENYAAASKDLFGDDRLVTNPDQVANDDTIAWKTAFWYWKTKVHINQAVLNGQFGTSTKAINGPIECSYPNNPTAQKRFEIYSLILKTIGDNSKPDPSGCA